MRRITMASMGLGLVATLGVGGAALAQEVADDGIEVTRSAEDLNALAATPADEQSRVETALVFTDLGGRATRVACRAHGADGAEVGRAFTRVPADGLRVILASDLSGGAPFAGRVTCFAGGRMMGKALLIAPAGMTQVGSNGVHVVRGVGRIHFPLVATR